LILSILTSAAEVLTVGILVISLWGFVRVATDATDATDVERGPEVSASLF
jgi:hypothetical protein